MIAEGHECTSEGADQKIRNEYCGWRLQCGMRIDKYLKNSRIIKRRTLAKDACEQGRVTVNGKTAKPGTEVAPGDIIHIVFGNGEITVRVLSTPEHVTKEMAATMYEIAD